MQEEKGLRMKESSVAEFCCMFRDALLRDGEKAFVAVDWPERCREFGFDMDCGRSFEKTYGLQLGDVRSLKRDITQINDVQVLGNAVFSQCRYLTHWAWSIESDGIRWLCIALGRLEELVSQ